MLAHHTSRLLTAFGRELRAAGAGAEIVDAAREAMEHALRKDEDVLTALVFERLQYLPADVTWRLLVGAATTLRGSPPAPPEALHFTFWPLLPHPTAGCQVEPDVLLEGREVVLVVEVKWHDVQTPDQLDREADAVAAMHPSKAVVVLALGGASVRRREELRARCVAPVVLALDWPELHAALKKERDGAAGPPHQQAVLGDLMAALALRNPLWARAPLALASLPRVPLQIPEDLASRWGPPAPRPPGATPRAFASLPAFALDPTSLSSWRLR